MYTIDSVKTLLTSTSLISYGNYLFEFKNKIKINSVKYGDAEPIVTSFKFDTAGVYLWADKNEIYYEFDTFALKNKMVHTGILANKPFGVRLSLGVEKSDTTTEFALPEQTAINNITCFYSEIVPKNKHAINDTIKMKVLLVKNKNLNSFYKRSGAKFTDNNYCIVGLNLYSYIQKQGMLDEIEALRPLTKKEIKLCENMVQKSITCITDTIKGLNLKQ
jgi:hypothetical protein